MTHRADDFYGDDPPTKRARDNWPLERVTVPAGAVYVVGKGWMKPCPCQARPVSDSVIVRWWWCNHDDQKRVPL